MLSDSGEEGVWRGKEEGERAYAIHEIKWHIWDR